MTTAARPTWAPAKGGNEQGGTRIFGPSQKYSSRDIASHTNLKPRKEGQDTQDELKRRNLRDELEDREQRHFSSKNKSYGSKREIEDHIVARSVDADDSDVEVKSDDERLIIWRELYERQQQEEELKVKEAELLRGNPLLNNPTSFNVKRRFESRLFIKQAVKPITVFCLLPLTLLSLFEFLYTLDLFRWDDDVVFKNQARGETKTAKRFINDTIRNDFHRKFLQKYMK
ncbi:hypothetical protein Fmac_025953 [Flemingia macrophylla]|uniref:Uncharacterized protein n=1 Tax=Flemingia macrophylla TaxID=520843 RepID=A0ABD1LDH4_9FABA